MNNKIILLFCLLCSSVYAQTTMSTMKHLSDTHQQNSYTNTMGEDADYHYFEPGYINNANGTITDTVTGLMWQRVDGGEMTVENAEFYCDTLTLGGFTNWRLPTCHELYSILDHDKTNPALDTSVFTKTLAEYWWSCQRQSNDVSKVWAVNAGGGVGNHPKTETISMGGNKHFHVRAVRDRQFTALVPVHFKDNGDGTIRDSLTHLTWTKLPLTDSLNWENALIAAEAYSFAGQSDWRLPNIKELQSINDETLISPSLPLTYFNVGINQKFWASTSLPNQPTRAWYLDTRYGITTYAQKTSKLMVLLVRGDGSYTAVTPPDVHVDSAFANISVYPNPCDQQLKIGLPSNSQILQMSLFDERGRKLLTTTNQNIIDVSTIPSGTYFISINTSTAVYNQKILIQHQ